MKDKKPETKKKEIKSKKTISTLVLSLFKNHPSIKSKEMIERVKALFPKSKFNVYHYSWYKYQIKKGRYTKLFDKEQLKSIFTKS